jgi:hypothetical protein
VLHCQSLSNHPSLMLLKEEESVQMAAVQLPVDESVAG